jgi:putative phosphoserine phosphatase / 1-acylglycerol-3-phosphate O-acyltransferase
MTKVSGVAAVDDVGAGPRRAAFFDLDRTLLAGGSAPVFAKAMERLGVSTPHIPGQDLLLKFYDLVGETKIGMQVARQAASRSAGLRRSDVASAAEGAVSDLVERVQPFVAGLFAEHRTAGDLLVLATTSPFDLVTPFARALGFDAVVATRYSELEGVYTGDVDGQFVWGDGKLAAVEAWAEENDVSMSDSAAYSDSFFDSPLLGAVGRPMAINPDLRLLATAVLRQWPVRWLDAPSGVPRFFGVEPLDVLRRTIRPEFFPYARFKFEGISNIPRRGPVIIAPNHRSYFDPLVISLALAKAGRNGRFLAKKEVLEAPVVGQIVRAFGTIKVDRGTGSDRPLREAAEALDGGEVVVILPQGTIPRGEAFFDPKLVGRPGVARLAAMTGAPVVPMGLWGTEKVWPRNSKVPNVTNVTSPPKVSAVIGEPVKGLKLTDKSMEKDLEKIMKSISALLPEESNKKRKVSDEELKKTRPTS